MRSQSEERSRQWQRSPGSGPNHERGRALCTQVSHATLNPQTCEAVTLFILRMKKPKSRDVHEATRSERQAGNRLLTQSSHPSRMCLFSLGAGVTSAVMGRRQSVQSGSDFRSGPIVPAPRTSGNHLRDSSFPGTSFPDHYRTSLTSLVRAGYVPSAQPMG